MTAETGTNQASAPEPQALPSDVQSKIRMSWMALALERYWPALWPSSGILGIFLALALVNVFPMLPGWLHGLALAGFVGLFVASIVWPVKAQIWPTRAHALRHLERSSGLDHRPISGFEDHMGATSAQDMTRALWRAHRHQLIQRIRNLKVIWPKLTLAARDPMALRMLVLLLVIAAAIAAGREAPQRLLAALDPSRAQAPLSARMDVWLQPPAYTGEEQRSLPLSGQPGAAPVMKVPQGTILTARVQADSGLPSLRTGPIDSSVPDPQPVDFRAIGEGAQEAKVTIERPMQMRLSAGGLQAGHWRFEAVPDLPPSIRFRTPLAIMQSQTLRFNYSVKDDYGVAQASATVTLADAPRLPGDAEASFSFELPLPPKPSRQGDSTIFKDLTAHRWAGLPVNIVLSAKDARDQSQASAAQKITLPERIFTQPLARALIEQRRSLVRDPKSQDKVARVLEALLIAPERFIKSAAIYLPLRAAQLRVKRAREPQDLQSAEDMLWHLALKVEEGDLPQAQAELRRLQQQLAQALTRGASEQEISALMEQLRAAVQRYLQAMQAQASGPSQPSPAGQAQAIRPQDLKAMLDQIQTLAQAGSADAAQQMLNQLQSMLENISPAGQANAQDQAAQRAMKELADIAAQQRALLDKTFREQVLSNGRPKPGDQAQALAAAQRALAERAQSLMKQLAQTPGGAEALQKAQAAMGAAAQNLGEGQFGNAGENQRAALENLKRGGDAMLRAMQAQAAQRGTTMPGEGVGAGESEDPFGRPQATFGPSAGTSVKVPTKADIQKTREILEELQRRASQRERPIPELEYIDRLLRRF